MNQHECTHIFNLYVQCHTCFPFIFIPQTHRSLCCTVTCLRLISGLSGCNIQLILRSQHSPMSSLLEFLTNHVFTWTIAKGGWGEPDFYQANTSHVCCCHNSQVCACAEPFITMMIIASSCHEQSNVSYVFLSVQSSVELGHPRRQNIW